MTALLFRTLVTVLVLVITGARTSAHEIGTTRVTLYFPTADSYRVEIATDGQALVEKLAAMSRQAPPSPSVNIAPLTLLQGEFQKRALIEFDEHPVQADVHATVTKPRDDGSPPMMMITLTGQVPAHARRLTWSYGWAFASYAFTVESSNGGTRTQWLEGDKTSTPIPLDDSLPRPSRLDVIWQYLRLGFTHIVPGGLDHILFVLGLFLLSTNWRSLMWQISAFTVAHTISLGLAMNGIVAARPSLVEPLIAISICYVALENVLVRDLKPWRIALVFAFGLLHGLGFAGVLGELGLPRGAFATSLVAFNAGVEGGQLAVIGAAVVTAGWWRSAPFYRRRVVVPASLAIAGVALYWTVQRLG